MVEGEKRQELIEEMRQMLNCILDENIPQSVNKCYVETEIEVKDLGVPLGYVEVKIRIGGRLNDITSSRLFATPTTGIDKSFYYKESMYPELIESDGGKLYFKSNFKEAMIGLFMEVVRWSIELQKELYIY